MRQSRKLKPGAHYHVVARVNNRELLMAGDRAKRLFEHVLERAKKQYVFSIENFVIMDNHFHLIIQPGNNENLSRIMQWIMSVYAMSINKQLGRCGHFWGSRFYSKILGSFRDYLATFIYIDENPGNAGLLGDRGYWRFSGQYHRVSGIESIMGEPPDLLSLFSGPQSEPLLE